MKNFIQDEISATESALYAVALRLYEIVGPSAVFEWGAKIGLNSAPCEPCEETTPTIGNCCAVCGSKR